MEITTKLLDFNKNDEETWEEVIKFLDKEVKIKEEVFERSNPKNEENSKSKTHQDNTSRGYNVVPAGKKKCLIYEKITNYVPTITNKGNMIINYFSCEKFANMSPKARFKELKRKKFCLERLTPGHKAGMKDAAWINTSVLMKATTVINLKCIFLFAIDTKITQNIYNYYSNIKQSILLKILTKIFQKI